MKARFYTLLFAILPRRLQRRLWNYLANREGYHGIHGLDKFCNGTFYVMGTPEHESDLYQSLIADSPPGEVKKWKPDESS